MSYYQMSHNIKGIEQLRKSFNELAMETFGISFERWYELGYWQENYIPHAFIKDNEVIANASITKSELVINEQPYQVIQIGTVMTKKEYQGQGLSRKLMEAIIEDYQEKIDFIYLFANETVLEFYPKFGFKRVDELSVSIDASQVKNRKTGIETCDFQKQREELENRVKRRLTNHLTTYDKENVSLSLFYFSTVFSECLYYISELDVFLTFEVEEKELHLYDVLMTEDVSFQEILSYLPLEKIESIVCHFQLKEVEGIKKTEEMIPIDDDALFILGIEESTLGEVKLPLFSHA
ncbi:GNAT family N-acetyltransferase [Vagococcus carniphilus]|uniref:GNAT family N-acetyltransferase n=1 Tax=Vagococcus carniphilus TaxID=218144 RepID=UPI0028921075|nr:GNAT family N-acetyltransferase [Vagococcus carniphilus]MDT2831781.1 GNAT family N-acetyltransferase [Vagococcus carniphilus]MDT2840634.1 GNAT family N-acetyltransferase [Vagococcus carniphilus]MDT2855291.1 GNAT family N-acetyltransferase [Vagococcus carniphilus]